MEAVELLFCLVCVFALSLSIVICVRTAVRCQNMRLLRWLVFPVFLFVADASGQGMVALAGAVKGEPDAEVKLGFHYLSGRMPGTLGRWHVWWPKNSERGNYWLRKAQSSGKPSAELLLARASLDGDEGLVKDIGRGVIALKRIATDPSIEADVRSEAAIDLAQLYEEGKDVAPDYNEALTFWSLAAECGNGAAYVKVGKTYEEQGDYKQALALYRDAVSHGELGALSDYQRLLKQTKVR